MNTPQVDIDREQALLRERARRAALTPPEPAAAGDFAEVFTFALSQERLAIETRFIREVARFQGAETIPLAPLVFRGLISLRGDVVPLLDLRHLLNIATAGLDDNSWQIVLGDARAEFAILADAVHQVVRVRRSELFDGRPLAASANERLVLGVTDEGVALLDGNQLLRDPRLFFDAVAPSRAGP